MPRQRPIRGCGHLMPTAAEIRRAIRRSRQPGRAYLVRLLRLDDLALLAIMAACESDLEASGADVHALIMETGFACTYNHVWTFRKVFGFKGRGAGRHGRPNGATMDANVSPTEILRDMPARLKAQLDQLPECERQKVLRHWAGAGEGLV